MLSSILVINNQADLSAIRGERGLTMRKYPFTILLITTTLSAIQTIITKSYEPMIFTWMILSIYAQLDILNIMKENIHPEKECKNE